MRDKEIFYFALIATVIDASGVSLTVEQNEGIWVSSLSKGNSFLGMEKQNAVTLCSSR
jgi:hypothetical protein